MRDFSKVSPKLWRSPRFRSLASADAKLLYVFALTCEHQSSAGCCRIPDSYAAADLGWTIQRLVEARSALIAAELLVHDPATEEYFVPRWYRHNPPTNTKHRIGIERLISELDSDHVREAAEIEFTEFQVTAKALEELPANGRNRLLQTGYLNGGTR